MKTEDLKAAFRPYVYPYAGSGFMTGTEDEYVIDTNAQICADIAINFAAQFAPKWIPVEERLPGYNQRVLAFTPDTDNTREDTRIIIYGSIPSGFPSGVTHWMPLPTKP